MLKQLFINKFQKGSNENANLGMSNLVGIDTYSKKGVAILAKKSTIITGGFTAEPHFIEISGQGTWIWAQCGDGSILYSADGGSTWNDTSFTGGGHGNGLIYFQNYVFAFSDTKIYYHNADPTSGIWTDWTTAKTLGLLQNFATNPISGLHFPYLYPNNRGVYFGNGNAGTTSDAVATSCTVGFFGQVGTTPFDPTGTLGTNFYWNGGILPLPSLTYNIGSIDFLPPANLAISTVAYQNPSQGSDMITWDTISNAKFTPPLRIFSNSLGDTNTTAGIKQLYNRNQVLYAVTGGNHTVFETNGSSFNLLEDIGLYSNLRTLGGAESDSPVFLNPYPQGICVVGNKLLTGVATSTNTSTYPTNSTTGIFPVGVWSIAFAKDGSHSTQCEFVLPIGQSLVSPPGTGNYAKITCIRAVPQTAGGTQQIMVGFGYVNSALSPSSRYGVALVDLYKYIDDITYTAIESELFEIGTALAPQTVNNIEINLAKKLLTGQTIDLAYRTSQDQVWTVIATYTGDGTKNYYSLTQNPIGATQFIQLRVRMATGGGGANPTFSPQLKTVILS